MDKKYKPIACGLYDELELRAIRKQRCKITFIDSGITNTIESIISDLFVKDKAEYLRTTDGREIRLDSILEVDNVVFDINC